MNSHKFLLLGLISAFLSPGITWAADYEYIDAGNRIGYYDQTEHYRVNSTSSVRKGSKYFCNEGITRVEEVYKNDGSGISGWFVKIDNTSDYRFSCVDTVVYNEMKNKRLAEEQLKQDIAKLEQQKLIEERDKLAVAENNKKIEAAKAVIAQKLAEQEAVKPQEKTLSKASQLKSIQLKKRIALLQKQIDLLNKQLSELK